MARLQELAALPSMQDMSQALSLYTERHYKRMGRLMQSTFVLDFLLRGMQVYDAEESASGAQGAASAHSSLYLRGTAAESAEQGTGGAMLALEAAVVGDRDVEGPAAQDADCSDALAGSPAQPTADELIAEALAIAPEANADSSRHQTDTPAVPFDSDDDAGMLDAGSLPGWGGHSGSDADGDRDDVTGAVHPGAALNAALAMGPQPSSKLKGKQKRQQANGRTASAGNDAPDPGADELGEAAGSGAGLGVLAPRAVPVANGAPPAAKRKRDKKRHSAPQALEGAAAAKHAHASTADKGQAEASGKKLGKRRRASGEGSPAGEAWQHSSKRRKSIS